MTIDKSLEKIAKTLEQIKKIMEARLELEREKAREYKEDMKSNIKTMDMLIAESKDFKSGVNKALGVKEEFDIDGVGLGDDEKK